MKNFKSQNTMDLELALQPVVPNEGSPSASKNAENNLSNLEFILTNSAFGFEYALQELQKEGEFGFFAEQLRNEIEAHKQTYFDARLQLKKLDESKLRKVESELRIQKMIVFANQSYLH